MTSEFRLFTRATVAKAKAVAADPDEPADPERGGGFAEWAMLTLHALRIELGKSYRVAVDLLSEMPGVLAEIGLTRLPHYTVLRTWFVRIPTKTWRAFLGVKELHSNNVYVRPIVTLYGQQQTQHPKR